LKNLTVPSAIRIDLIFLKTKFIHKKQICNIKL
jgi:hypothetical protein